MKIKNLFNKAKLSVIKHGPQLMIIGGVAATVVGAIMACKETLKVNDILDEAKDNLDKIHMAEDGQYENYDEQYENYDEQDAIKDKAIVFTNTAVKLVKNYALPVAVMGAGITSILAGNKIMKQRYAAISAAYATLDGSFKGYRERVKERFGEQVEKEIRYNLKAEKYVTTDEDGNAVEKEVVVAPTDVNGYSPYAQFFDVGNPYWEDDLSSRMMFLKAQEQYANDLLISRGYLYLNEVYENLGLNKTKAGQIVGWIYDPENNDVGDNYVDFGIFNVNHRNCIDFVNGDCEAILLDFNVDGNIWDKVR